MLRALLLCMLATLITLLSTPAKADDSTYLIEHSFDLVNFLPRTSFKLHVPLDSVVTASAELQSDNSVSMETLPVLKTLLANKGLYRIRIRKSTDKSGLYVSTAIPACELQKSGFREDLLLHLDSAGEVMGLSYSSPVIALPRPCDPSAITSAVTFVTKLHIAERLTGQVVPLQAIGPKPEYLKNVRMGDADKELDAPPQSFLRKYWYIAAFMAIFLLVSISSEDEKATKKRKPEPGASSSGNK